ncbi:pilus assembly protein PilM [Paraburkholderia sp. SARCC-3016]|jgi:Tfp pilus assembly PilM family ATPase|uniref:pilus assembly protein PilM n=1 Tax=Paraburkholderia sp. SARCC-3016 TaxID=3058611 RepID=UPI0028067D9F|nr:pilus assembly protein PilM [Paraburkholderia sp. SARCC-3016]MDQ7980094.1 pilus assembly protein PilM [Paraburkholderia sp. SARCC-3016]
MALKTSLEMAVRRFAAGIDLGPQTVRLVVLSRSICGNGPLRIDCVASMPVRSGAMAGAEIVDRPAVAQALFDVFDCMPSEHILLSLRCAMAIPGSATLTASVPLEQLQQLAPTMRRTRSRRPVAEYAEGDMLSALEPAVLIEIERIAGVERHALAVDWYVDRSALRGGEVTIAATARQHLEARIECAAIAGISLTAIDGEPHAALRAMRYSAKQELEPGDEYAALWVAGDGVYGWRLADDTVVTSMHYPSPEHGCLADALRDLGEGARLSTVFVAGDVDLLDGVSMSLADIGDVLGCMVFPFECTLLGQVAVPFETDLLHDPASAVAFGLAVRGVYE